MQVPAPDKSELTELFSQHRDRLRRMVRLRMDSRLQGRIDPSDILQETCVEALQRYDEYLRNPSMPLFLWLRFLTGQKLLELHRRNLDVQARDVRREISLHRGPYPEATSAALAAQLVGQHTTPSQIVARAEIKVRLQEALNSMDELDREVLALRHFEQLTNSETARTLEIEESAASKRYVRALKRLKDILTEIPGTFSQS